MADPVTITVATVASISVVGGVGAWIKEKVDTKRAEHQANEATTKILRSDLETRMEEEACKTNGEPIWFSLRSHQGQIQHWVLYLHGQKYELRHNQAGEIDDTSNTTAVSGRARGRHYEFRVRPYDEFDNIDEQRYLAVKTKMRPEIGGNIIVLIGWTNMTKEDVNTVVADEEANFKKRRYNIFTNNCQHILIDIASKLVSNGNKARDWSWFANRGSMRYLRDYQYADSISDEGLYNMIAAKKAELELLVGSVHDDCEKENLKDNIRALGQYLKASDDAKDKHNDFNQSYSHDLIQGGGGMMMSCS